MPQSTALPVTLPARGGDSERIRAGFAIDGIAIDGLAAQLPEERAPAVITSWTDLISCIKSKSAAIRRAS